MSVYVDDMRAPFGRLIMCHMIADSSEELHAMAETIGVARRWCQYEGTSREHYDIALSKRALAVAHGAQEITMRELATKVRVRTPSGFDLWLAEEKNRKQRWAERYATQGQAK